MVEVLGTVCGGWGEAGAEVPGAVSGGGGEMPGMAGQGVLRL